MKGFATALITAIFLVSPLFRLNPADSNKPNIFTVPETTEPTQNEQHSLHTVTVTVTSLDDIKVKESQKIQKGQIISDRTSERQQLERKKRQLELAIKQLSVPMTQIATLPPPNLDTERTAINKAKFELDAATQNLKGTSDLPFKDSYYNQTFFPEKVKESARLKQKQIEAGINVETSIARLSEEKTRYQQQQYQHSIQLAAQEASLQKQRYELTSLVGQLQDTEKLLGEVVEVRSPYAGTVRRVKVLGQSDREIKVEVVLDVSDRF